MKIKDSKDQVSPRLRREWSPGAELVEMQRAEALLEALLEASRAAPQKWRGGPRVPSRPVLKHESVRTEDTCSPGALHTSTRSRQPKREKTPVPTRRWRAQSGMETLLGHGRSGGATATARSPGDNTGHGTAAAGNEQGGRRQTWGVQGLPGLGWGAGKGAHEVPPGAGTMSWNRQC